MAENKNKVCIIGIGKSGKKAVKKIRSSKIDNTDFLIVKSNKESFLNVKHKISEETELIIIIGNLTKQNNASLILEFLKNIARRILVICILTIPDLKNNSRYNILEELNGLKFHADSLFVLASGKIKSLNDSLSAKEINKEVNRTIYYTAIEIVKIISGKFYELLDFEILNENLKNSGFAAVGIVKGNKIEDALKKLMKYPLFFENRSKTTVNMLIIIKKGLDNSDNAKSSFTSEFLQDYTDNNADIVWEIYLDKKLKNDETELFVYASGIDYSDYYYNKKKLNEY